MGVDFCNMAYENEIILNFAGNKKQNEYDTET